jgi:hypothetical protein
MMGLLLINRKSLKQQQLSEDLDGNKSRSFKKFRRR